MKPRILGSLALIAMLGCATDAGQGENAEPSPSASALAKPGTTVLNDPGGLYFAEVSAAGTGCPAGSWLTSVSSDGQVFTTTFSAYELSLTPQLASVTKDCALTMKLRSDDLRSFAVVSVYYSGFALLEPGVSGRQTVRYGFHGSSADAGNSRKELAGPLDEDFVIRDDVGVDRQRWSPCGVDHVLTASTELRLRNGTPRASGYLNLAATDGSIRLDLKIAARTCPKPAGASDAGPAVRPNSLPRRDV